MTHGYGRPNDEWLDRQRKLAASGGLFHFRVNLKPYGDPASHDLDSELGVLAFTIDFVNRQLPPVPELQPGMMVERPRGQNQLRNLFRIAVHGPASPEDPDLAAPSDDFIDELRRQTASIEWVPQLARTGTGAEWRHHAFIDNAEQYYALVATLLMDEKNRREIGECRHCNNPFIVKRRAHGAGRPEKWYCEDEHRKLATTAGARGRQMAQRTRRRAEQLLAANGRPATNRNAVKQAFKEHPSATADELAEHARAHLKSLRKHK